MSNQRRLDYITTFLERDIPDFGIRIPAETLRRFWEMTSFYNGQIVNSSNLDRYWKDVHINPLFSTNFPHN